MFLALSLAGCGTTGGYQGMSAEQISALAKMKDANINCIKAINMTGSVTTIFLNLDKGVVPAGNVTVNAECQMSITNAPVPK